MIAPTFHPVHGGAGLRFYRYLPFFHEHAISTTVICGTPKEKKFTEEDLNAEWQHYKNGDLVLDENLDFARILKYKIATTGSKQRSKVLLDRAIEICINKTSKPDIVHIIAPMPYAVIEQLKKIKKFGIQLIYSHTIAKEFSSNPIIKRLQTYKLLQVYKQYDHILVQSNTLRDAVRHIYGKSRISVIPNGVDTEKFAPVNDENEKKSIRLVLNLPVEAKMLISVGAIHPRKGTDILVAAWAKLAETNPLLHLVLVGPRYDKTQVELQDFTNKINSLINKSGCPGNIHFVGQSQKIDLYLKASDIFVFSSKREGMPNAVLEAMSTRIPVVLTPFEGLSEELGIANKHFLLATRSVNSLQSNILKLIDSSTLSNQISGDAREWILNHLTLRESVNQHVRIFQNC